MNSENNTPKNNNKNGRWRKKKNKKKPYYLKNDGANDQNVENSASTNEVVSEMSDESASTAEFGEPDMIFEANDIYEPEISVSIGDEDDVKKIHITGVRFKPNGKIYYFDKKDLTVKEGEFVIVDTARGLEFGEVAFADREVKESSLVLPLREVVRVASKEDIAHNEENKKKEDEAFKICLEKIQKHELDMKLIEAQYSFDNSKLLFYFTSASRVDFRELVKDLASVFKTRIELRQIGIRDEAKLMGGLGACGRPLCCSTFLSDFVQVSIRMAKEQNLSLNSGKISGLCGRLMCCLQYEYSTYAEESAKTPPVDCVVKTKNGIGYVTETNPLAGTVKVKLKDNPDVAPEIYKREDVTVISKSSKKDND